MINKLPISHQQAGNGFRFNGLRCTLVVVGVTLLMAGCGRVHDSASAAITVEASVPANAPTSRPDTSGRTRAAPADVSKLLVAARRAYAEHRVVAPAGDNAMEYYVAVLAGDPGNQVATGAVLEIFPYGVPHVQASIASGDFDEAGREIELLAKADPHNYTVELLRSELAARQGQTRGSQHSTMTAARDGSAASAGATGRHVLVVHVSADSWVEVAGIDDGKVESGVLRAGESRTYHAMGRVKVTLGNANGVTVTADGRPIDVDRFRRGKVAHLVAFVSPAHGSNLALADSAPRGAGTL